MDDAAFARLAAMSAFRRTPTLRLPGSRITDASLCLLERGLAFVSVDFSGTRGTDTVMASIGRFPGTLTIILDGTGVSGPGVDALIES